MQRRKEGPSDRRPLVYEGWMKKEGIPVYETFAGIADLTELPRRPWARMGGLGTFIEMEGTKEGRELLYVAEIPGGKSLEPEKHLYDELIYILRGRGLAEVWQEGQSKLTFEWGEGSLFAIPLNAWHRLANGGREPVLFFAVTSAPLLMNALRNTEFIFNCDYNFIDRYKGEADYFVATEKIRDKEKQMGAWETNFVPDLHTAFLGDYVGGGKVEGGRLMGIMLAGFTGVHTAWWPVGKYHMAHWHGPGAVLLGLNSEGYVLLWNRELGIHPFQDGHADEVVKVDWKPNGIYVPPTGWFHQHFNSGGKVARQLAIKGGGLGHLLPSLKDPAGYKGSTSVREGGNLIRYEDEDPEIRRMFEEELRKKGNKCTMEPVVYRTDPF